MTTYRMTWLRCGRRKSRGVALVSCTNLSVGILARTAAYVESELWAGLRVGTALNKLLRERIERFSGTGSVVYPLEGPRSLRVAGFVFQPARAFLPCSLR